MNNARTNKSKSKGAIIRERYEATASGYDELYRGEQFEKYFTALRRIPPKGLILDAGCGTALLLEFMALHGLLTRITGYVCLDYSRAMLQTATTRIRVYCKTIPCTRIEANIENLPFRDKTFNTVYSFTVLDLVDNIQKAINELKRVSRGPIIVSLLKKLPYKNILIKKGYTLLGTTTKDAIFLIKNNT